MTNIVRALKLLERDIISITKMVKCFMHMVIISKLKTLLLLHLITTPSISKERAKHCFIDFKNIPTDSVTGYIAELFIKNISDELNPLPKLVYKIYLFANHENNNEVGYVDAHSCKVLLTEPSLLDWAATGTFATRYSGTRQAITQNYSGAFHLADSTRGAIIHTWNLNGNINVQNRIELSDNDNNWTAAEHSATENDMGLDVHWALQQIYDRLNTVHGINSFNDNGFPIDAHIRYGTTDNQRDNAFWDPTLNVLVFGDGNVKFRPVACIDAVAHEFGHGITDFQIGWGATGDPRAFNEGLSDIWGAIMESRIRPSSTWQIGEQIDLSYSCLRNIQSTNDQNARDKIANTFGSTQYNSDDPYVRSGVFSHWFYLLVNGGTGTNDLGRSYSVRGIGMDYAENLIVKAVFDGYLRFATSYAQIRTSMINAAREIAGANSFLEQQIENAWYAVGVGSTQYQYIISGPSSICSQATYTIDNLPEGATVQWSVNIPYVTLQPGQDSVIVQKTGSGFINLTASIFINGTLITTIVKEDILVGGVAGLGLSSYSNLQMLDDGSYYKILPSSGAWSYRGSLTVVASGSNLNYSWSETYASSNFIQWSANGATVDVYSKYDNLNLTLKCTASNSCGSMNRYYSFTTRTNPILPESIILSPNPASDYVDVTVFNEEEGQTEKTTSAVSFKSSPHYQIQLWNSSGLIKTIQTDQPSYQLDLTGVPPGFYYVHVIKDGQTYRRQLVVQ